jgi:AraC-like DNA-binding protein
MKAIVVTDKAAGTAGMKLMERPELHGSGPNYGDVVVQVHASGFTWDELSWPSTKPNGSFRYDAALNLGILDKVGHRRHGVVRPAELISAASRHSLNVHRLSWLAGGVARSPEPSGGRSARESTQAGTGFSARDENLELLRAIATSKVFTEFERAFVEATGLPVALEPVQCFELSFHDRRNQEPFFALVAQENRTCGGCLQSHSQVADAAMENSHATVCYAGLSETAVPLQLGKRLIGFLRTGPVFRRKQSERHVAAVKLLTIFAEHLAILSNQILIQRVNAEPPMITKAKEFIRKHHAEDLSLPQVAQIANASPFYFCKLFKRATGLTFTKFVSRVRIESSKDLLTNPQRRVSEVAYEVGFQSLTQFNRVFKKILGQSPTEYRRKMQNGDKSGPI